MSKKISVNSADVTCKSPPPTSDIVSPDFTTMPGVDGKKSIPKSDRRPGRGIIIYNIGRYLRERRARVKLYRANSSTQGLFYIIFCRARKYGVH